jgi:alpha-mannosidase
MTIPGETGGSNPPRLYIVATAHLDTQWRWTVRDVIRSFLPRTLRENFALFETFPDYILSFEGAFRYMLAEEYYPREFERLTAWIRKGRWRIAGSMIDAPDINLASPESLIRHVLYASRYFKQRFGHSSVDIFLPDCFGFPFSLPTIAAHCGLLGFSSQKFIKWMAPSKTPFDVGLWEGPDGSRLPAVLNPGQYGARLTEDLSRSRAWKKRLQSAREDNGLGFAMKYFGLGDRGGSPDEASLFWLARSISSTDSMEVVHSGSDQLFRDLEGEDLSGLPTHRGELLLPTHGTGCWTSQAILKSWNRQNELLADCAERAASIASWLAQFPYPTEQLRNDWIRFLWHQMHDDLTGTSIPEAYEITWNDQALSLNRFATVLTDAVAAISRGLDTETEGIPLVLFNPLSVQREEAVEAILDFSENPPAAIRVFDPHGNETPSQIVSRENGVLTIVFLATLSPLGLAAFEVRSSQSPCSHDTGLNFGDSFIENQRFRVTLDKRGDLGGIFDKLLDRNILADSARLELLPDRSRKWPAWEILYEDLESPAKPFSGNFEHEIIEDGPARVAIRLLRRGERSSLSQTVRLSAQGAGDCIEVLTEAEWHTRGYILKASFTLACPAEKATYDLGCGVIERANNTASKHEVPAHQWADLSNEGEDWGVSILSDCKYGWDKPNDQTLRLSLLRSPRTFRRFPHQGTQDHGRHRFAYALYPHHMGWREAGTVSRAERFNQPIRVFRAKRHAGVLGRELNLLSLDSPDVAVRALKRSEDGGEWVLRLQETAGSRSRATLRLGHGVGSAREIDGCERIRAAAQVEDGELHTRLRAFQPKSFAVRITPPETRISPLKTHSLVMSYDTVAASFHSQKRGVDFDGQGHSMPGELLPQEIMSGEIPFRLFKPEPGEPHCVTCRGQALELPEEDFDTAILLATAASEEDCRAVVQTDGISHALQVHSWSRPIGQWRLQRRLFGRPWGRPEPGYLTRTPVGWVGTHRHDSRVRDQAYAFCYLFRYALPLPTKARILELPDNPVIRIFAITLAQSEQGQLTPASSLYS